MQCVLRAVARAEALRSNRRAASFALHDVKDAEEAVLLARAQELLTRALAGSGAPFVAILS